MINKSINNNRISIIGAGSWGTALAIHLCKNGHTVSMWTPFKEEADMINLKKEHVTKLPGVTVPTGVHCTTNVEDALKDTLAVVMVVPSQLIRKSASLISEHILDGTVVINCAKGIDDESGLRLSEVIALEIPQAKVAVLCGPSHAEEVGREVPTTVVAAAKEKEVAEFVQDLFMSPKFRVYTNPDVIGVELGAALKNVIALCAGISDGLGFGDNTKAALMTRGMVEIARLGTAMGAQSQTFAGLTGVGDLIVTCTSMHSRNRRAGILIGQGKTAEQAMEEVKMVVEGVSTTKAAYALAKKIGVEMPITNEAYEVLFKNKDAKTAVADLMMRSKTHEVEEIVQNMSW